VSGSQGGGRAAKCLDVGQELVSEREDGGGAVAGVEDGPKFDHVVSVMFENRSLDNLLGRLYPPGEVASFEGVLGRS
jgi:phospholipase C